MYRWSSTYTDYYGVQRTEEFLFNLTKAELVRMNLSQYGGLDKHLKRIVEANDMPTVMDNFRNIIRMSYGKISEDGRRFVKSEALSDEFEQTEAYSELFMTLISNPDEASAFARGIMPKDLVDAVDKQGSDNVMALPTA